MKWLWLIVLAFWAARGPAAPVEHVILISVDGLRPDAIEKASAPRIKKLIAGGAWCPRARTVRPSLTVPAHASMLTGLDVPAHGVKAEDFKPGSMSSPSLFQMLRKAGKTSAGFLAKPKMRYLLDPKNTDYYYAPPVPKNWDSKDPRLVKRGVADSYAGPPDTTAKGVAAAFAEKWPTQKFQFAFVHLRDTDVAGHAEGWMSPEYLDAVERCDEAVGVILDALEKSGDRAGTLVIVTSDHGGEGNFHFEDIAENNTIPWIASGPGVPKGLVIRRELRIFDATPTVLRALGVAVPDGLDGRAVEEVLGR